MARTQFESLDVYKLAEELSDLIWDLVTGWRPFEKQTIGRQIVGSADSVGANIAECAGRGSFNDNRRFVKISRASLYETKHWLRRAFRRGLLTESQVYSLQKLVDELTPRLNAYIKSIRASS